MQFESTWYLMAFSLMLDSDFAVSCKNRYSSNNWMVKSFILPVFCLQKKWVMSLLGFHSIIFNPQSNLYMCKTVISTGIEPANGETPWISSPRTHRTRVLDSQKPRLVLAQMCGSVFFGGFCVVDANQVFLIWGDDNHWIGTC